MKDDVIELNDKKVLNHKGSISNSEMENVVEKVYEKFEMKRKLFDANRADEQDLEELKQLETQIKSKK